MTALPTSTPEATSIYAKAAHVLRERGLAKRTLEDSNGQVCLNGALNIACHGDADFYHLGILCHKVDDAGRFLSKLLRDDGFGSAGVSAGVSAHVDWNNRDERTADEAIALLERADAAQ